MHLQVENKMDAGMGPIIAAGNWENRGNISFDEEFVLDDSSLDEEEKEYEREKVSLFIPMVFPSITEKKIKEVFHLQQIGDIGRVDFVEKIDGVGKKYKHAYIYFNQWYSNKTANGFYDKVCGNSGIQTRIVYDDPWYWIVRKNSMISRPSTNKSSRLIPSQVIRRAFGIVKSTPATTIQRNNVIIDDREQWECKRIAKDVLYFGASTSKPIQIPATESTNLVSEDYVKHIEEMNADLLDKIQLLETKTGVVSEDYVARLETANAELLVRIVELERYEGGKKSKIRKCCGECEKEKNRIYMAGQSEGAAESIEQDYFEYLRGK